MALQLAEDMWHMKTRWHMFTNKDSDLLLIKMGVRHQVPVPNGNNGSENSLHQALHMPAVEYTYLCSVLQCGMDPQQTRSRSVCAWEVS